MYAVYKQAHPPTGLEFSMYCNFFNNSERNLVVAGTSQLYVYRLNRDAEVGRPPAPPPPTGPPRRRPRGRGACGPSAGARGRHVPRRPSPRRGARPPPCVGHRASCLLFCFSHKSGRERLLWGQ